MKRFIFLVFFFFSISIFSQIQTVNYEYLDSNGNVTVDIYDALNDQIIQGYQITDTSIEKLTQAITTYKEQWKQDGQAYYDEMQNRIIAMLIGVENAVAIMTEIKKTINPMLEQIQRGNQALAMLDYMDGENNPTIQEVTDLFNEIGQYCINYYQTKYPH